MTDYTWPVGSSGTMMIRDTGTYVEFWLKAGSATFSYDLPWGYTVNGVTDNSNEFRFESGGAWQRLGRWNVTVDQTVTFRMYDTGTSGLGSGETNSAFINRSSAPPAPPGWVIEQIRDTSVQGDVDGAGNGGLAIDQYQVAWSKSSTIGSGTSYQSDDNLDGYQWIYGLTPNTTYYFWNRTHNPKGWSPWSARTTAKTHSVPPAPTSPVITNVTQSSAHALIASNGTGGVPILEWEIGYGTDPSTPTTSKSGYDIDIPSLVPGAKHYFWGRGRNTYGWGPYSVRSEATLLAGAYVDVAGVKKRAVPYVKVAGVWKVAEMRVNIKGLWKGTG